MSVRGYCRTVSERMDCRPAIRITRLTTTASTGRRMKRSVNFIALFPLAVLRPRRRAVRGLDLVVDLDGGAVAELEDSRGDHLFAGLDTGDDRHLIAARAAELHELLAHVVRLAGGALDHEDRITVRGVAARGGGEHE